MKKLNFLLFLLLTMSGLFVSSFAQAQGILRVKAGTTNATQDGSSWSNAISSLSTALSIASDSSEITEIWVAQGTYYPEIKAADQNSAGEETSNRSFAFVMLDSVAIYGGFNGTETNLAARADTTGATTILSGEIGTANDSTDNCLHLVIAAGDLGTAQLNGFTISGGCANQGDYIHVNSQLVNNLNGGGIYNNSNAEFNNIILSNNSASNTGGAIYDTKLDSLFSTLNNITITGNKAQYGGAIYMNTSSAIFNNLTISENEAEEGGGIFVNHQSSPIFNNITISNNTASIFGGGICNSESFPTLNQATISGNTSITFGGGIYNQDSTTVSIYNTIISENKTARGGGIYSTGSTAVIYNSIISGNKATHENTGGGALYNNGANATMYNVILSGNIAPNGGAIFNSKNSIDSLYNVTISGNIAENGGAMYNYSYSTLFLYNSIIWGNDTTTADKSIFNYDNSAIPTYFYCLVEGSGSSSSWNTSFGNDGDNNNGYNIDSEDSPFVTWIDPSTLDSIGTTDGDYHLVSTSLCVDAGKNSYALTDTDLEGNARIYNNKTVDMGAYESLYTRTETGISADIKTSSISVYPTLATDWVYITSDQTEEPLVNVYSLSGHLMFNGNTNKVNVSDYEKGIYIIDIAGEKYKFLKK